MPVVLRRPGGLGDVRELPKTVGTHSSTSTRTYVFLHCFDLPGTGRKRREREGGRERKEIREKRDREREREERDQSQKRERREREETEEREMQGI